MPMRLFGDKEGNGHMIILASGSPRRRELLENMGIRDFTVRPSAHEEPFDEALPEGRAVEKIALMKGRDAARSAGAGDIVIAADTLVFLDGRPLGKPADEQEAAGMLRALSGREHRVITAAAILRDGREYVTHVTTAVRFRPLSEDEIDWYVGTGEPLDKAGAYGIQGLGGMLIEGIRGDYFNVVGLPVAALAGLLGRAGYNVFSKGERV